MTEQGFYAVTTKHDRGEITIFVFATNPAVAKRLVMDAERCPERAILSIERRPPADQLQPEISAQVFALGYRILPSDQSDDCFIYSACNWDEDSADFATATEAAEFLIKEKADA